MIKLTRDELLEDLSIGGSHGNLEKWLFKTCEGKILFVKNRSSQDSLEPESEVCSYHLALLLGVQAIPQYFASASWLSPLKLSASYDFSHGQDCVSLFRYARKTLGLNFSLTQGESRYKAICSLLTENDKILHDSTLALDYIIGNPDRHLRNFELRNTDLVEAFDFGESLFSKGLIPLNTLKANPYERYHKKQFRLLTNLQFNPYVKIVDDVSIKIVLKEYLPRNKVSALYEFVIKNYHAVIEYLDRRKI